MREPFSRNGINPGYRQGPPIDSFMFNQQHQPPMQRNSLPVNISKFNPVSLLNSPQISKGIGGLSGMLNNLQQILRVVETTTPIIQEYGPMLKNLPAMYRMMKAFNEINDEPEEKQERSAPVKAEAKEAITEQKQNIETENAEEAHQARKEKKTGLSTPKLYI